MSLIAKVLILAHKGKERVAFQPGDEIPSGVLSDHDLQELKGMGSIEDTDETEAAGKKAAAVKKAADKEFKQAKAKVTASQESIQAPATPPAE